MRIRKCLVLALSLLAAGVSLALLKLAGSVPPRAHFFAARGHVALQSTLQPTLDLPLPQPLVRQKVVQMQIDATKAQKETNDAESAEAMTAPGSTKAQLKVLQQTSGTDSIQLATAAKQQDPDDDGPMTNGARPNCLSSNRSCLCNKRPRWQLDQSQYGLHKAPIKVIGVYFVGWELTDDEANWATEHSAATVDVITSQLESINQSPLVGCCGTVAPYALHLVIVVSSKSVEKMKSLIPAELLDRIELVPYARTNEGGPKGNIDWGAEHDEGIFEGVALNALRERCINEETVGQHTTLAFYFHAKRSCPNSGWRQYLEHYIFKDPEPCVHSLLSGNDTCGVDYWPNGISGVGPHYSGNFWWTRCGYVAEALPRIDPKCRMCSEAWVGLGVTGRPGTTATSLHDSGSFLVKHGFNGSGFYALVNKKVTYKPSEYFTKCGTAVPMSFGLEGRRSNFKISPDGHPRCEFTSGQTFGKAEFLNRRCGCHRHLRDCQKEFPWDVPLHTGVDHNRTQHTQRQASHPRNLGNTSRKDLHPRNTGCHEIKSRQICCNSIDSRYEMHGFLDSKNESVTRFFGGSICLPLEAGDRYTCEPKLLLQRQKRMNEVSTCDHLPKSETSITVVPPPMSAANDNQSWSVNASELSLRNGITNIHGVTLSLGEKVLPPLPGCRVREKTHELYDHLSLWPDAKRGSPRILCSVYTQANEEKISNQVGIWHTWGQTCDKLIFWTDKPLAARYNLPYQVLKHGIEAYDNMWSKVRAIWKQIRAQYFEDFDYFTIGGDDTFLIVENLRKYLLSEEIVTQQQNGKPLYLGRPMYFSKFNLTANTGGASYVLNKAALTKLMEFLSEPRCSLDPMPGDRSSKEDVKVGCILHSAGVKPFWTVAGDGQRFQPLAPHAAMVYTIGSWGIEGWLDKSQMPLYNNSLEEYKAKYPCCGIKCCSAETISFHYIGVREMIMVWNFMRYCRGGRKLQLCSYVPKVDEARCRNDWIRGSGFEEEYTVAEVTTPAHNATQLLHLSGKNSERGTLMK